MPIPSCFPVEIKHRIPRRKRVHVLLLGGVTSTTNSIHLFISSAVALLTLWFVKRAEQPNKRLQYKKYLGSWCNKSSTEIQVILAFESWWGGGGVWWGGAEEQPLGCCRGKMFSELVFKLYWGVLWSFSKDKIRWLLIYLKSCAWDKSLCFHCQMSWRGIRC